jgi:hypothetical protein
VAWVVVGVGAALRLVQWADGRSLWLDESRVALNLLDHSYTGLLGDLQFQQAAPFGFLLLEKLVADLVGYGEHALRLVPLVAGLASLLVFARLSGKLLAGMGRVTALVVFALSPALVYYSAELKQYSLDVLATVVILLVALTYRNRSLDARALVILSLVGGVGVWFSHASVFALAGSAAALAFDAVLRSDWRRFGRLVVPTAVWALTFAVSYLATRANTEPIRTSLSGSSDYFDGVSWFVRKPAHLGLFLFGEPVKLEYDAVGYAVVVLAGLLAALGAYAFARDDPFKVSLVLLPMGAVLGAAFLELYPFYGRFVLFALPLVALLIGRGIAYVASRVRDPRRGRVVSGLAASAIAAFLLVETGPLLLSPREREELRPVLEHVRDEWRAGDVLYIHAASQHPATYYAEVHDVNVRDGRVLWPAVRAPGGPLILSPSLLSHRPELVVGRSAEDERRGFRADLGLLAGEPRVWFVFSHVGRWEGDSFLDDLPAHLALLDRAGARLAEFEQTHAVAYLYDLARPASD